MDPGTTLTITLVANGSARGGYRAECASLALACEGASAAAALRSLCGEFETSTKAAPWRGQSASSTAYGGATSTTERVPSRPGAGNQGNKAPGTMDLNRKDTGSREQRPKG